MFGVRGSGSSRPIATIIRSPAISVIAAPVLALGAIVYAVPIAVSPPDTSVKAGRGRLPLGPTTMRRSRAGDTSSPA
jgi:hypothetical protein